MKAKIYLLIVFIFTLFAFSACNEDDGNVEDPNAAFTASKTTAKVGEFIQFTNTSENATAFRWSFGDGTMSTEISPKKIYDESGEYTVSLVSTGEAGSIISSMSVTIIPDAVFTVEDESNLIALTPVQFTNLSKGATSYTWSFGNAGNDTSTEESPEFSYLTGGTYTVTLTATSPYGETTVEREITVKSADTQDIYFIEYGTDPVFMRKLALNGSGTVTNFFDMTDIDAISMAYHTQLGKVFISGLDPDGDGKVWSVNLNGTGLTVVASGLYDPYGITVDQVNNKFYVAEFRDEDDEGHIYRANLNGSGFEAVITLADADFASVTVDPENNKMYFVDINNENIHVSNLDGTAESILIPGAWGYTLVVDTEHDKLYYEHARIIRRADLNGSNIQIVDNAANTPATTQTRSYGMLIDNETDKIYWSGRDSGSIIRANLDGTGKEVLKSGLSSPRGIFLRK